MKIKMKIKMKKIFLLITLLAIFYSCSTSEDGNGNSTTTVVPVAPSNLTGTAASTTQINLSWTDNSTNETGFKIERKTGTGTYAIVGTTATDVNTFNDTGLTPSATYTYRVYSNNAVGNSPTYSNELTLTIPNLPTLITRTMSNTGKVSATSGGDVTNNGGSAIISSGLCWSTNPNPTVDLSTKTINLGPSIQYSSNITGLNTSTTYYVRAYATNSAGTGYGNQLSFVTQNSIDTELSNITIGTQIWTTVNLDVSTYRDGTPIPSGGSTSSQWSNLTTGAWKQTGNNNKKFYNGYAVLGIHDNDPNTPNKILAPQGWHIPTDAEWITLINYLGGVNIAGAKMKKVDGAWNYPNYGANNESGFSGLPSGVINYLGGGSIVDETAVWWAKELNGLGIGRSLSYNTVYVSNFSSSINYEKCGLNIRCIRD